MKTAWIPRDESNYAPTSQKCRGSFSVDNTPFPWPITDELFAVSAHVGTGAIRLDCLLCEFFRFSAVLAEIYAEIYVSVALDWI
jgi:hypothetical protein